MAIPTSVGLDIAGGWG